MEDANERRRFPRLSVAVDIQYRIIPDAIAYETGATANISAGGICLIIYEALNVGSVLELNIYLPDGQPIIKAKGRIVWIRPFNVAKDKKERFDSGIEFLDINESDKKRIDNYVFSFK